MNKTRIFKTLKISWRIVMAVILVIAAIISLTVFFRVKPILDRARALSYTKMESISDGTFVNEHNTQIYDKNDSLIGEINISNFEYVDIDNISSYIKSGYMAVEDRNFETHSGIDYQALMRAAVELVKNKGEVTQGGSTITQQVLKNNVLNDIDSSWERKIVEFFLAPEFEQQYSKEQIMEYYCNTNYYGNGCYGVEAASQYYFGKSANDVTLAEAAGLCGISNSPSRYNPVDDLEAYKQRREKVLGDMLECGYISELQYNESNKDEVNLVLKSKQRGKESYPVSFAIHCATLREMDRQGFEFQYTFETKDEYDTYQSEYNTLYQSVSDNIRNGGYRIYTSIDMTAQNALQGYLDEEMSGFTEKAEDGRYKMQAAATVVDNETGYVIAIVGGRGTDDEFNRAYQSFRQPGSCAKPILDYGPAFDTGYYYPSKMIRDEKSDIAPSNWDNIYRGKVSVREALERSINAAAFYVMQDITPKSAIEYLAKMKFSGLSYLDTYNGSMALGGFTYGTTTYEMAKAYGTFVNDGVYDDKDCLRSVMKLQDGQMIEVFNSNNTEAVQVYTKDTSYMIIDCLKGVISENYATGKNMEIPDVIAAGKTGTTNSNKDGWFCGVTPKYSIAVWAGYDIPQPVLDMGGGKYPGNIYKDMMTYLMADFKNLDFDKPDTVELCYVDSDGDMTSRNTGKQDLFSMTLIQEAELRQKENNEKIRQLEEERLQREQNAIAESIQSDIDSLSDTEVTTLQEYTEVLDKFDTIGERIDSVISSITKEELNINLTLAIQNFQSEYSTLQIIYDENKEKERLEQEEQNRIIEENLHTTRVATAEQAVSNMEQWQTLSTDSEELIANASKAVNDCQEYEEYSSLKERYDTALMSIRVYQQSEPTTEQSLSEVGTETTTEISTVESTT